MKCYVGYFPVELIKTLNQLMIVEKIIRKSRGAGNTEFQERRRKALALKLETLHANMGKTRQESWHEFEKLAREGKI